MERVAEARTEDRPDASRANEQVKAPPRDVARPELDRTDQGIAAAIFALTVAYLWVFRHYTSMEPDEGIVLEGAQRILRGEVLYRDFFSYFTPGSYYFLALLFKIFGSSFLVARTALVFFGGVYSTVAYLLAGRVCSRTSAIFAAGIVTLTTLAYRFEVLHNWDSTLWACLAVYCAVRWLESPRWTWAFATGSLASVTCLFEQSKGAGLVLGLGVGLAAVAFLDRQKSLWNRAIGSGLAVGMAWLCSTSICRPEPIHSIFAPALWVSGWGLLPPTEVRETTSAFTRSILRSYASHGILDISLS